MENVVFKGGWVEGGLEKASEEEWETAGSVYWLRRQVCTYGPGVRTATGLRSSENGVP